MRRGVPAFPVLLNVFRNTISVEVPCPSCFFKKKNSTTKLRFYYMRKFTVLENKESPSFR